MVGFLTAFGTGALTGVLNEQKANRDERAENTRIAMERLTRIQTQREAQLEAQAQRRQMAAMYSRDPSVGMSADEIETALEADPGAADLLRDGRLTGRRAAPGAAPVASVGGVAGVNPRLSAAPAAAADPRMAAANSTRHQLESGGRMTPGIYGDGGRAAGPGQVHPAALADVNARHGTNYTHAQLAADPAIGKQVGDQYYAMLLERFNGDHRMAGAAYNGGPTRLARDGFASMPQAAQQYGNRVGAAADGAAPRPAPAPAPAPDAPMTGGESGGGADPIQASASVSPPGRPAPILGQQARSVMDRLFGRVPYEKVGEDAARRFAGIHGFSPEHVASLNRPLERRQVPEGMQFSIAPESRGAIAKDARDQAQRLEQIDRTNAGNLAVARERGSAADRRPITAATSSAIAINMDKMLADAPSSPFRAGPPRPDGSISLVPRALPNTPQFQQANATKAEAVVRAEEIYADNPRGGMQRAIQQALQETGLLGTSAPERPAAPRAAGAPASGGARQPAPPAAAPVRVTTRAEVEALAPGTRYVTPDGRIATRNGPAAAP